MKLRGRVSRGRNRESRVAKSRWRRAKSRVASREIARATRDFATKVSMFLNEIVDYLMKETLKSSPSFCDRKLFTKPTLFA